MQDKPYEDSDNRQSAIDKLVKLLKLAERAATPGEAAAAAAQAARIMLKYNIEQAEIGDGSAPVEPIDESQLLLTRGRLATWLRVLASVVARGAGCRMYKAVLWDGGSLMRLVGRKSDIQVANYLFTYLRRQIDELTQQALASGQIYGRTAANNFRFGVIDTVASKLKEAEREVRMEASSTALVRVDQDKAQLDAWCAANLNLRKSRAIRHHSDAGARAAGRRAGESIDIHRGVEAAPSNKRLA